MAQDKNPFGGGNKHGLYVPITEDEQEVIHRLVDSQTLMVIVHPWGICTRPSWVGIGDKRVALRFGLVFNAPALPTPVKSLDLELVALGNISLIRKPYPTILPDGTPLLVGVGVNIELQWDIAIDHLDPELVKRIKPGALGLTSRRLDPVTKERTVEGNMRYRDARRKLLHTVEAGEVSIQEGDQKKLDLLGIRR